MRKRSLLSRYPTYYCQYIHNGMFPIKVVVTVISVKGFGPDAVTVWKPKVINYSVSLEAVWCL